jgi:predicted MFS family arabinose efflux permease
MGFCYGYGSYFFFTWFPTYLVRARNFTEKELLLASCLFLFGACANLGSGLTSDFLLRRAGLKAARCRIGMAGFACAALFALLAAVTSSKLGTLFLLCLSYSGICFTQPMIFPTCIEVAKKSPGSMAGAQNTTNQVGSFLSGVLFGYVAKIPGSYDRPLFLLALVLAVGALLWLKINPEQELVPNEATVELGTPYCNTRK